MKQLDFSSEYNNTSQEKFANFFRKERKTAFMNFVCFDLKNCVEKFGKDGFFIL